MERIIEKIRVQIPEMPKAKRVAAYARVSSGKDAMLHSLSAQVSYYSRLIQNHAGWLYCGRLRRRGKNRNKGHQREFPETYYRLP